MPQAGLFVGIALRRDCSTLGELPLEPNADKVFARGLMHYAALGLNPEARIRNSTGSPTMLATLPPARSFGGRERDYPC